MANCPFHEDDKPSMKIYDKGFCCYIEARIRHANYVLEHYNPDNSSDKYHIEQAKAVLALHKKDEPIIENSQLAQKQSVGRADEIDKVPKTQRLEPVNEASLNDKLAKNDTEKRENYKITDEAFGVKGRTDRLNSNIQAIALLKQLERDNRLATPEEQEILSGFTGWGSLPQVFDEQNSSFANQREKLQELLTEDEYSSAMSSTLNAHYTAPVVISAIYEAIEKMGFNSGNILEPACGTGNFFGLLPENMTDSKLYGVELDSITGRIAQQLYPNANISVTGFEKKAFPDNFFDVTVGNVPFGGFKVPDKQYDKHNFLIHDYFIAKSLDKVRPGGVLAIVTSKGTMDKKNPAVRKYIAQRAELVGAIRLPNNAFKANAGTEVTSDILFFQKRDRMIDIEPDWVHLGKTENGLPINQYFIDNPDMVLGEIIEGNKLYGDKRETDTTCVPFEGAALKEQLKEAVSHIRATIPQRENNFIEEIEAEKSIPADPNVKNLSYTVVDGSLYYRQNSMMDLVNVPAATADRIKGMVEIRDCVRELIDSQLQNKSDSVIENQQAKLNSLYDSFVAKHGRISEKVNSKAFREDSSLPLLSLLVSLQNIGFTPVFRLDLKGEKTHSVELGSDIYGNLTRINNALDNLEKSLDKVQNRLSDVENQLSYAKEEMGKPFPQEAELQQKLERLGELELRINIEKADEPIAKPKGKSHFAKNSVLGKLDKIKGEVKNIEKSDKIRNEVTL